MKLEELTIVVFCNKNDLFFARICIASIRYYYPHINIEIVKDAGNGKFNTKEVEKYFNVSNVDLKKEKMGWGGGKFHYLYTMPKGKKVLIMDADIVFVGNFIERLITDIGNNDYLVSIERTDDPYADWVKEIYFDTKKIEAQYPNYSFPGFFFNTGQVFLTGGAIDNKILDNFFDISSPPYWKNLPLFPLVDQSVYNYLLPTLASQNQLKLGTGEFMLWSKSNVVKELTLEDIKLKKLDIGLIHWAGDLRINSLTGMTRKDLLQFFEQNYYSKITHGYIKHMYRRIPIIFIKLLKLLFKKCKPFIIILNSFKQNHSSKIKIA